MKIPHLQPITSDTIVAVTGSTGGIDRATAIEFGRHGAKVALLARGQAGLAGAAAEVERAGGQALTVPTDMSDADQGALFEAGRIYSEREVNDLLKAHHTFGDWALLRRELFESRRLDRNPRLGQYWVPGTLT